MTCIIGYVEKGCVYMGCDSAGVAGFNIRTRKDSKVFIRGNMLFGYCGSFRMGQILRYSFQVPYHKPELDDFEYLCTSFIDDMIKCFKDKGYAQVDKGEVLGGFFLLGYKGNLYNVESDFQVGMVAENYNAYGCGEQYALGAIKTITSKGSRKPTSIIKEALGVAEYFSAGVQGPFEVLKMKGGDNENI